MEINMLKWYGQVIHMEDSRWPKRIMAWSPEGRRPEIKLEKEVLRAMKQRNFNI